MVRRGTRLRRHNHLRLSLSRLGVYDMARSLALLFPSSTAKR